MTDTYPLHDDESAETIELLPEREHLGLRLDKYVAEQLPDLSRSYLQQLIADGLLLVDGFVRRPSFKITPGQVVSVTLPEIIEDEILPEDIPLDVIFEDDHLLVVNKPVGMVVYPAAGHSHGTLANAVLHHAPIIAELGGNRPGIVHRLDRDTSGIMVVAKTQQAVDSLTAQWQAHRVAKAYIAVATGVVEEEEATIDVPIGRSGADRQQMAAVRSGKDAVTHLTVRERFGDATLLNVSIETGRTHQIRVHLAFIGHPIVGDAVYGNKPALRIAERVGLKRQFLHASSLAFDHPATAEPLSLSAPPPADLIAVLDRLRATEEV